MRYCKGCSQKLSNEAKVLCINGNTACDDCFLQYFEEYSVLAREMGLEYMNAVQSFLSDETQGKAKSARVIELITGAKVTIIEGKKRR